jgi:hypothetical protein
MIKEYILKEAVLSQLEDAQIISDGENCGYCCDDLSVAAIPAADVTEARHGEWKKVHDEVCYWLACSVCGEEIPKRFGTDYYTNYCPNCGAKMDGGVHYG